MTEKELQASIRQVLKEHRDFRTMRSVMKTDGGRLKAAGRAFVEQALRDGIPQATIARLLEITPSAVSYRANN
jgi:hypothetical protein